MTVRFSVTIDIHHLPTVRHVRDLEESLRQYARRHCCCGADLVTIGAERIDEPVQRLGPGREFIADTSMEQIA